MTPDPAPPPAPPPRTPLRGWQRAGGALILALGTLLVRLVWHQVEADRLLNVGGAVAGPAFAVIGLALVLIPGYREERLSRGEDVSRLEGTDLLTLRWWCVLGLGLAAGLLDWYLLVRR